MNENREEDWEMNLLANIREGNTTKNYMYF